MVAVGVVVAVVVVVAVGVAVAVVVVVAVVVAVVVGRMNDYRELLIGCGRARDKRLSPPGCPPEWRHLVTLDHSAAVRPDLLIELELTPWAAEAFKCTSCGQEFLDHPNALDNGYSIMLADSFDEIHAYEVLEHLGSQGDARAFFAHFSEIWRVLKPGGYLVATVPSRYSGWLWGDPSHRRAILPQSLPFLDQTEYARQCDVPHPTSMSDFRDIYRADFKVVDQAENRESFMFYLQAVKPSRWKSV